MPVVTHHSSSADRITCLLLAHDIRPTTQRVMIAGMLLSEPQHLSADQVLARVNRHTAVVSKATVYNTLNLFAEKGLIRQVIIESGRMFYDSNTLSHHHIYNEDTGMLYDINAAELVIGGLPELPEGTVNIGVDIVIRVRNKP